MPSLTLSIPSYRPSVIKQTVIKLAAIVLLLLVTGCATGPRHPLCTPLAVAGSFGFTDQRLSDNTYRVIYVAPRRTVFSPYASPEPGRTALLSLANDMALMRAADLTIANGQQTFRITQRDNDADVDRERRNGWCDDPFMYRRPYYYPPMHRCGPDGYTFFNARSTITFLFGHKPGEEHFIARDVLAQLAVTYPTARTAGSAHP